MRYHLSKFDLDVNCVIQIRGSLTPIFFCATPRENARVKRNGKARREGGIVANRSRVYTASVNNVNSRAEQSVVRGRGRGSVRRLSTTSRIFIAIDDRIKDARETLKRGTRAPEVELASGRISYLRQNGCARNVMRLRIENERERERD